MERELAEAIVEAMGNCGFDAEIEEYSGRGMYGKTTTGVKCDSITEVLEAVLSCPDLFVDEDYGAMFPIDTIRQDSLGLSGIIY